MVNMNITNEGIKLYQMYYGEYIKICEKLGVSPVSIDEFKLNDIHEIRTKGISGTSTNKK